MTEKSLLWRLFLNRLEGISSRQKIVLFDMFESAENFIVSPSALKNNFKGFRCGNPDLEQILQKAREDLILVEDGLCHCITFWDKEYPELLRQIPSPPFALFIRGSLPDFSRPAVAVVGTRRASENGLKAARDLAGDLASLGWMVVSGLAKGIDEQAHKGAVEAGGITGAVLASGVDLVYPKTSRSVASEMLEHGGFLISEYSPGVPSRALQFPVRNRIIAGLCRAVIVVEAPEKSGALITSNFALDFNREVLVHSGMVGKNGSEGTTALYAEGASAISGAKDFLESVDGIYGSWPQADMELRDNRLCYREGVI